MCYVGSKGLLLLLLLFIDTYICSCMLYKVLDKSNQSSTNIIGFKMKYEKACKRSHSHGLSNLLIFFYIQGYGWFIIIIGHRFHWINIKMPYYCGKLQIKLHIINHNRLQLSMKKNGSSLLWFKRSGWLNWPKTIL